jgi:hypothetical protein
MRTLKRGVLAIAVGGGSACGAALLIAVAYAIADLYVSGHDIKPAWFDAAANALVVIVAVAAAVIAVVASWRVTARS